MQITVTTKKTNLITCKNMKNTTIPPKTRYIHRFQDIFA